MQDCNYPDYPGCNQDTANSINTNDRLTEDQDVLMEQILENINTTPIGKVLKRITSLPEMRREKILDVRHQLTEGKYELSRRLDLALEKVLDDLGTS